MEVKNFLLKMLFIIIQIINLQILHLPPELGETTQREQDDVPIRGCGGTSKNKLDF